MLKKEFFSHYLVALIWMAVLVVWRVVFTAGVFSALSQLAAWIFFCGGAFWGTMFLDIDQIIYALLIHPEQEVSLRFKGLMVQKRFEEALNLLAESFQERINLPFHNALFQVFFMGFCFWVLTSTGSWFGRGLVMAMALHLLKDEIELLFKGHEDRLRLWLFWPIKRKVSFEEQKVFVILMLLVFLGLNLLIV